jgi:hypothetical protein
MILKAAPVAERAWMDWLTLFEAANVEVRRLALEKLADRDTPALATAFMSQLDHPDRSWRDQVLAALARLTTGRQALASALLKAPSPDLAWTLARAQSAWAKDYPATLLKRVFDQACTFLEANDRRADPSFFVLREAGQHDLNDRLAARALALRKKKDYAGALVYWRLLGRDPSCGDPIRFELAACGLRTSAHDLAAEARSADPCLDQFAGLLHRREIDLLAVIKKATWLTPEDLFYLGFHFLEGNRNDREFGAEVLRLVVHRAGRSKLAKDAKSKLKSEGFQ